MINGTVDPVSALDAPQEGMAGELPEVGTEIFLVLGEGVNFRSRLVSIGDDGSFEVAAPLESGAPVPPSAGEEFDVFWVPPRTRVVQACRLVATSDEPRLRWRLTPAGPPRVSNRREFVRGGGAAAVRLTVGGEGNEIDAALLDISEGGLRCWLDEPIEIARGEEARAVVQLGADDVHLSGKVHTIRDAPEGDPGRNLVLTFHTEESVAQMIRLYIRAWEITERRTAV